MGRDEHGITRSQDSLHAPTPERRGVGKGGEVWPLEVEPRALVVGVMHGEGAEPVRPTPWVKEQDPLGAADLHEDVVILVKVPESQRPDRADKELRAEPGGPVHGFRDLSPCLAVHGLLQVSLECLTCEVRLLFVVLGRIPGKERRLQVVAVCSIVTSKPHELLEADIHCVVARDCLHGLCRHLPVSQVLEVVRVLLDVALCLQYVAWLHGAREALLQPTHTPAASGRK
mmetsp:Transcript_125982/g.368079  ORF Transcript_125982/g.368079 Transcript_125982/m.368079 type:complete len:229 (+) Transcript_125982:488-1174(+)